MLSTLNGRKQQEKKKRNHTRTWNYEIVKLLEQRDKNWRVKEKRVEEFLLPCLDTLKPRRGKDYVRLLNPKAQNTSWLKLT
jgi:hypothetical protein